MAIQMIGTRTVTVMKTGDVTEIRGMTKLGMTLG